MKALVVSMIILASVAAQAEVWIYSKFGPTKHDSSPCSKADEPSVKQYVKNMTTKGNALHSPCKKTSESSIKCKSKYADNYFNYFAFNSENSCIAANKDWKDSSADMKKVMDKVAKENEKSKVKDIEYNWMKSSSGDGCWDAGTNAKVFRSVCKEASSDKNNLHLDCSESGMTMQSANLYASQKACEEANK